MSSGLAEQDWWELQQERDKPESRKVRIVDFLSDDSQDDKRTNRRKSKGQQPTKAPLSYYERLEAYKKNMFAANDKQRAIDDDLGMPKTESSEILFNDLEEPVLVWWEAILRKVQDKPWLAKQYRKYERRQLVFPGYPSSAELFATHWRHRICVKKKPKHITCRDYSTPGGHGSTKTYMASDIISNGIVRPLDYFDKCLETQKDELEEKKARKAINHRRRIPAQELQRKVEVMKRFVEHPEQFGHSKKSYEEHRRRGIFKGPRKGRDLNPRIEKEEKALSWDPLQITRRIPGAQDPPGVPPQEGEKILQAFQPENIEIPFRVSRKKKAEAEGRRIARDMKEVYLFACTFIKNRQQDNRDLVSSIQ
eukprot:gnl/MRDRNA2_/MRDRNA2_69964_c0_seq2.p1 gnl/MRDRNA2_/MRDRNA2_69964_c0~~gnl/MRDRNA2_/MRDRNA2_69964_c0_seq2.p1  ORF type:complete len:365 (+),score=62.24 gnl/MRDRNA2_/MRDRNA2_69964_c0_seq2:213-1307(+)